MLTPGEHCKKPSWVFLLKELVTVKRIFRQEKEDVGGNHYNILIGMGEWLMTKGWM